MGTRGRTKTKPGTLGVITILAVLLLPPVPALANHDEVVIKDRRYQVERLSVSSNGAQGGWDSGLSASASGGGCVPWNGMPLSDDGRFVAYTSNAGNLDPNDVNGDLLTDVFVRDRKKGTTELISTTATGLAPPIPKAVEHLACVSWSAYPALSADGRYIAFGSRAMLADEVEEVSALTPFWKVYLHDRKTGETRLISRTYDGSPYAGDSGTGDTRNGGISVSANGRYVVFDSTAHDLVPNDGCAPSELPGGINPPAILGPLCPAQVYLYDRRNDSIALISRNSEGVIANGASLRPQISDDGSLVIFMSAAGNLSSQDQNSCPTDANQGVPSCYDVYGYDVKKGEVELISLNRDGMAGSSWSWMKSQGYGQQISSNGRFVVFESSATDLVPGHSCMLVVCGGIYVRDRKTGRTERAAVTSVGRTFSATNPSITDDGRYVLLGSGSYCGGGAHQQPFCEHDYRGGVYLHDRETGQTDLIRDNDQGGDMAVRQHDSLSGDGRYHVWTSNADAYVVNDVNEAWDVFGRRLSEPRLGTTWTGSGEGLQFGKAAAASGDKSPVLSDAPHDAISSFDSEQDLGEALTGQGANLYGASLAYRPDLGDLYATIELEYMPQVLPGLSPIFYGLHFEVADKSYQVRATSLFGGTFGLFDCSDGPWTCHKVADLRGGYGTTGMRVVFSLPLKEVGLQNGGELSEVGAFSAIGSYLTGATKVLDTVKIR